MCTGFESSSPGIMICIVGVVLILFLVCSLNEFCIAVLCSGVGNVHENANFRSSKTDFPQREQNCPQGREIGETKKQAGNINFNSAPNTR